MRFISMFYISIFALLNLVFPTTTVAAIDPNFPYGAAPQGNVCTTSSRYATPETMLGSWAMIQAVANDKQNGGLSSLFTPTNVVYAVGTAAIGDRLGIPNCSAGCNQLNGFCFALKFNGPPAPNYPYMIFQSVNIGAAVNTFDIYLPGGGSGAFSAQCPAFWGTTNVNWAAHIENVLSCNAYFNNFQGFNSQYSVTYNGVVHPALQTLKDACTYASSVTNFYARNWTNVAIVPVTCPKALTQVTGLALASSITTVGNQTIKNVATITAQDFTNSTITPVTTTQMQDCKTPSSGFCGNLPPTQPNYQASISATLTAPVLNTTGPTPCTRNLESITLSPLSQKVNAGSSAIYKITIKNNDTGSCAPNVYSLTTSAQPTLFKATLDLTSVTLSPGASSVATLTLLTSRAILSGVNYTNRVTVRNTTLSKPSVVLIATLGIN